MIFILLWLWIRFGPIDDAVLDQTRFASATIVDRNGVVLYEPLAKTGTRGEHLTARDLPPNVVRATVAAEDRRFFSHIGVDPVAIVRATVRDVRARAFVEGGSTITQQVAKLLLQSQDRSPNRKVREAVLALRLEHRYSKADILAMYLSLAPYGSRITGVARASRTYFGCAPQQLTVAQAAYLAGLPHRPSVSSLAAQRQRYILEAMHATATERNERLQFAVKSEPLVAQHFVEEVLRKDRRDGSTTRTTLDAKLQQDVQGIIKANRDRLIRHGAHAVAVAVLDNRTGEWLAWEGSGDYYGDTFGGAIDGVTTPRQPGSALKPFTYAVAFEEGSTPETVLPDVPTSFPTAQEGVVYTPRNYDGRYRGSMSVRSALAGSENVPAVAMLAKVGPPALLRTLRTAGLSDLSHTADYYGLGLTLGDAEVRLDQLVAAYATFARGGVTVTPTFIHRQPAGNRQLFSQRTAFWISDILSDADAREFIFGRGGSLDFPFRVAVKTGTSQAYRDNWTVGFTRDVTVGVWVGNFDRRELRNSSGVTGAAPIFHSVMLAAMKRARGTLPIGDDRAIVDVPSDLPVAPVTKAAASRRTPSLRVTNPPNGATYLIDPTLRSSYQQLHLRATSDVVWHVDGRKVDAEWTLVAGTHTIVAADRSGHRDSVKIFVK